MEHAVTFVVGVSKWRAHVETGKMKVAKLLSVSDEVLVLLIAVENNELVWKHHALLAAAMEPSQEVGESLAPRYIKKGRLRDSWDNTGLQHFNVLMEAVCNDRSSAAGKRFEKEYQELMKKNCAQSRKQKHEQLDLIPVVSVHNELEEIECSDSDMDSDDE